MNVDQRKDLVAEAAADKVEIQALKATYNEATGFSWFWALLFGPIYFWVHGFLAMGFVILLIAFFTYGVGLLSSPFFAYYCWSKRATEKAENAVALSKLRP